MADGRFPPNMLLDLVGEIYDASIEPAKWPTICERLAQLVDGIQTAIALHDTLSNQVSVSAGWNIDPALEAAMQANLAINPLVPAIWHVELGEPFTSYGYLGEQNFKNSRFYKQAALPFRIGDSALAILAKSIRKFGALSIQRADDQPPFGQEELQVLRALTPHIRRAVMITDLLDARALERDLLAATLDRLSVGIVLTDGDGRIAHTNEVADRLFDDGNLVRRHGTVLSADDINTARELAQAIRDAGTGTAVQISRSGIAVPLRSQAGREFAAWILPLDGGLRRDLAADSRACVAVFVREIGDATPFPAELFVRRYGITPGESRVMSLLVQGMTIQEVAETLGISLPTAKTHLAHLFDKTGTTRQAELIRLVMSALSPTSASDTKT